MNEDPDGDGNIIEFNARLPGQWADRETGLSLNGFRTYDPSLGRYISSDPIGLDGGSNAYAYANLNPLHFIDPNGQEAILPLPTPAPAFGAGAATAGAAVIGAGAFGYGVGSLIYPHIAIPLGDLIDKVCRQSANPEDCRKEKEGCIELCSDIADGNDPDRQKVWGGSFSQCIKNCLPERCGGEGLWKGYK